jgi:hypothetical protein
VADEDTGAAEDPGTTTLFELGESDSDPLTDDGIEPDAEGC